MVVICCTQQLMRNGRNVTIFKKFGYSTGNRPLSFKNYVEKNSVPRSDKGHLYECKRFHSPRDTRTKATKLTPQEIATCGLSESRGIRSISKRSAGSKTLLDNPKVRQAIISGILAKQGTSPAKIQEIINAANGNVQQAVNGINAELGEEVVRVEGNVLRLNPDGLRNILQKSVDAIAAGTPQGAPVVAALQSSVSQQLSAKSVTIPLDVAHQLVRKRRDLQPRDLISGITGIVSDLVVEIIGQQLAKILVGILDSIKNTLSGLLIVNAPGNPIGDLVAGIFNFVIKGALQLITTIEQSLSPSLQTAALDFEFKQKRGLGDIIGDVAGGIEDGVGSVVGGVEDGVGSVVGGVEDGVGSVVGGVEDGVGSVADGVGNAVTDASDVVNGVVSSGNGLLDEILGPIIDSVGTALAPVNALLKDIINAILTAVQQILGTDFTTLLENLLDSIIDLLIPVGTSS